MQKHHADPNMSEWSSGLCSCFSEGVSLCCCACFVPCFVFGENYQLLKDKRPKASTFMDGGLWDILGTPHHKAMCLHGLLFVFGFECLSMLLQCHVRGKIREASGLQESCLNDLCATYCCYSCALVQERRQLERLSLNSDASGLLNHKIRVVNAMF